jgi:hypothetical protein
MMKWLSKLALVIALLLFTPALFDETLEGADPAADQTWDYVRVTGVANDQLSLDVEVAPFNDCKAARDPGPPKTCQQLHLVVKDTVVKDRVKQLQKGDRIKITFTFGENNQNILDQFCMDTAPPVSPAARLFVLLVSGLVCLLLCVLWTRSNPLKLTIGEDGRYSNSKFQIAVWFFVLLVTYIATMCMRVWFAGCDFIGGVNIPQNLLLISGMSVLTFGGAKAITTSKVEDEKAKLDGNPNAKNSALATANFFRDLTHNDGKPATGANPAVPPQLDFGDFQMLIITLVAVATYLVLVFNFLGTIEAARSISLPDVDTTILAAFGLGHGAYLTKKAAGNVGQS